MSRDPFDDLARHVLESGSRRGVFRAFGATLLSALGRAEATVSAAPKRRPPCRKAGAPCSRRRRCCAGARCRGGRCRCLPGKKACRGACIPRGRRCSGPGSGTPGRGNCPPNQLCCGPGMKSCGQTCVSTTGCCTTAECGDECRVCGGGVCILAPVGTPCGGDQMGCNSRGVCAHTCDADKPCSLLPEPTTPSEFCRQAAVYCRAELCEIDPQPDNELVPLHLQVPGDCKVLICSVASPDGVAPHHLDSDNDLPVGEDECAWNCFNSEPVMEPRPANSPCNNGNGQCDGLGNCVDVDP